MRKPGGRDLDQPPRQVFGRLVGESGEDDLVVVLARRPDRLHDRRVAVAVGDDPPGGDGIEDARAVLLDQTGAVRLHDTLHRRFQRVLGEGMPDG